MIIASCAFKYNLLPDKMEVSESLNTYIVVLMLCPSPLIEVFLVCSRLVTYINVLIRKAGTVLLFQEKKK